MLRIRHERLYIGFLGLIAATPPLATDMYLAAIPRIADGWGVGKDLVNLSLVLWFASFSLFLLVFGPLSDRFGRRPVLLGGLGLFALASVLCAIAPNVYALIAFRILQGMGAAAPSSMCMAICRDRYEGPRRQKALAWVGVVLAVAPMVAPMIGAMLLKLASWRWIFATQTMLSILTLVVSLGYEETVPTRTTTTLAGMVARYGCLFGNRDYMLTNTTMGLILGPFYGFIAFSPIAYIAQFGLSERSFSLLFGLNALASMLGAVACSRLTGSSFSPRLVTACLIGCLAGGTGLLFLGAAHPLSLAGCMAVVSFCCGMSRPLSGNLILEQVSTDIGAASAFLIFYQFMIGSLCMSLVSRDWPRPFLAFGLLAMAVPALVLAVWLPLGRSLKNRGRLPA